MTPALSRLIPKRKVDLTNRLSYAGIGSRQTPAEMADIIRMTCDQFNASGWVLRSGRAEGADSMFEVYADRAEIFVPYRGFGQRKQPNNEKHLTFSTQMEKAFSIAALIHPAWDNCTDIAMKLHARNVHQVLGEKLDTPVEMVVCWTPGGATIGGTATAIRLALELGIPVYNLGDEALCARWVQALVDGGAKLVNVLLHPEGM